MQKKKVLHIIDSFGTGGAETWLLACVKYLYSHPELNVQFDFLASGGKTGVHDDEIKKYGSEIFYAKYSLQKIFVFGRELKKILRGHGYCAIHNHTDFVSGWHFLSAAGSLPAIRVAHVHNPWNFVNNYVVNPFRWFSFRMGRLLTALLTTKITGTSDAVLDEYGYNKWPFKKKRVMPAYCGFDVEKFLYDETAKKKMCDEMGWDYNCRIGLFAGRIGLHNYDKAINQKNPSFALSVARELVKNSKEWNFIFAGYKGIQGWQMENELKAEGLSNRIKFMGLRNDLPSIMSASEIIIFPSLWEGLGMVAVEAQAAGLPVLASDTVPEEAIVCDEIYFKKRLSEGALSWVKGINSITSSHFLHRDEYNKYVLQSRFSINASVNYLLSLYQA